MDPAGESEFRTSEDRRFDHHLESGASPASSWGGSHQTGQDRPLGGGGGGGAAAAGDRLLSAHGGIP